MPYYKAVSSTYGKWASWSAPAPDRVDYAIGVASRAPEHNAKSGYHLTVFKERWQAVQFALDHSSDLSTAAIFECEIDEEISISVPMSGFVTVKEDWPPHIIEKMLMLWPEGTVMAKEVILTKKLTDWDE